jgi:hypothetical protein
MPKLSLIEQRQGVEALINCAISDEQPSPYDVAAAKQAVMTLGFLERNADVARVIATVMKEFPGSEVEVR